MRFEVYTSTATSHLVEFLTFNVIYFVLQRFHDNDIVVIWDIWIYISINNL